MGTKRFVISTRDVDASGNFVAEPGQTRFLVVPGTTNDFSPSHEVANKESWRNQLVATARWPKPNLVTGTDGEVLIFVHGYNNTTQEVLRRTDLLQTTLTAEGWNGIVVAFDWPSENSTLNYLEDRLDASGVAGRLVREVLPILIDAQSERHENGQAKCTTNVHMLGHSTGAYVIMEAFAMAEKVGEVFRSDYRIGQVAFVGGDVSAASLESDCEWAAPMYRRINRLTNYSNGFDSVLAVSNAKRLGTAPRVGRVGLTSNAHPKSVNVDTSDYFAQKDPATSNFVGTFCHSWHIGDTTWARDMAMALDGKIDRNYIPTRELAPKLRLRSTRAMRPAFESKWEDTSPAG